MVACYNLNTMVRSRGFALIIPVSILVSIFIGLLAFLSFSKSNNENADVDTNIPSTEIDRKTKVFENSNGYRFQYNDSLNISPESSVLSESDLPYTEGVNILLGEVGKSFPPTMTVKVMSEELRNNRVMVLRDDCERYSGSDEFDNLESLAQLLYQHVYNPDCHPWIKLVEAPHNSIFKGNQSIEFTVYSGTISTIGPDGVATTPPGVSDFYTEAGGFSNPPGNRKYIVFENDDKFYLIAYDNQIEEFNEIVDSFELTEIE